MNRQEMAEELERQMERYASAPVLEQMEHRTLQKKGIGGPTAAHAVEEVHVPLGLAYMTFTTGSSAFQTPVGVTWEELPGRKAAGQEALRRIGVKAGDRLLVTYPPLVNVFSGQGLREAGVEVDFLRRSCREALLSAWCRGDARFTIGESTFLRAALEDAKRLGLLDILPSGMTLIAAGTPLDGELVELADRMGMELHDLYGCQEFGWLALDGVPLRSDLRLLTWPMRPQEVYPVVGGIPVGDCFAKGHHRLNPEGELATHARRSPSVEWETVVLASGAKDPETVKRTAKSVLRLKSRVVKVASAVACGEERTVLRLKPMDGDEGAVVLTGPEDTKLWDDFLEAQRNYQKNQKRDDTWTKS